MSVNNLRMGCRKATPNASDPNTSADVAVIGLGRVGLPLALSFADRGLSVIGIDNDPRATREDLLREGLMPFQEMGAQDLLDRVATPRSETPCSSSMRVADAADAPSTS